LRGAGVISSAALIAAVALGCQSPGSAVDVPNRDDHGPADVSAYIRGLQSPRRLQYLQPDLVIEKLALPADAIVADIGSGPGVFSLRFARACPDGVVYAADVEPRQLDAVRAHMAEVGVANIVPVLASYGDPHLPPHRIDLLFISDAYHHLSERVDYMRNLRRYLKPDGRLAVLEYRPGDLPVGPPADHKLSEGERQDELREAGWERVTSFETHQYHEFEIWRLAGAE
jgi:ubiquinone/menaquinone biosynthesis C-methylase UbiE